MTWDMDRAMPCQQAEDDPEFVPEAGNAHGREGRADEPPVHVTPAPRFLQDLKYLSQLMDVELYQAKHLMALFVIGDAISRVKGAVVVYQHGLDYELGTWSEEWRGKSSNVREAENLTDRLERLAAESVGLAAQVVNQLETLNADNALADHEVFVLADNSAFEGSYYKGHLTSRELSDIEFCLFRAQRAGGFILHGLHISGKRMKATGMDGLSRGDHTEGMMAGEDPMSFLQLHQGADTRSRGRVGKWVHSWWRTSDQAQGSGQERDWGGFPMEEVNQDNMFELKNVKAARLWMLSPADIEVAIKLLWEDMLAHPQWHMTHMWRRAYFSLCRWASRFGEPRSLNL